MTDRSIFQCNFFYSGEKRNLCWIVLVFSLMVCKGVFYTCKCKIKAGPGVPHALLILTNS